MPTIFASRTEKGGVAQLIRHTLYMQTMTMTTMLMTTTIANPGPTGATGEDLAWLLAHPEVGDLATLAEASPREDLYSAYVSFITGRAVVVAWSP